MAAFDDSRVAVIVMGRWAMLESLATMSTPYQRFIAIRTSLRGRFCMTKFPSIQLNASLARSAGRSEITPSPSTCSVAPASSVRSSLPARTRTVPRFTLIIAVLSSAKWRTAKSASWANTHALPTWISSGSSAVGALKEAVPVTCAARKSCGKWAVSFTTLADPRLTTELSSSFTVPRCPAAAFIGRVSSRASACSALVVSAPLFRYHSGTATMAASAIPPRMVTNFGLDGLAICARWAAEACRWCSFTCRACILGSVFSWCSSPTMCAHTWSVDSGS